MNNTIRRLLNISTVIIAVIILLSVLWLAGTFMNKDAIIEERDNFNEEIERIEQRQNDIEYNINDVMDRLYELENKLNNIQKNVDNISAENTKKIETLAKKTGLQENSVEFLIKKCKQYNIDYSIILALFEKESGFDTNAVGPKGSLGMRQLHPSTAPTAFSMAGLEYDPSRMNEQIYSMRGYLAWYKYLKDKYNGDLHKTLTAYNRGTGGLSRYISNTGTSRSSYSRDIIEMSKKYRDGI